MAAYVMVQLQITDPEAFKKYAAEVPATIARFDGRYLIRGGEYEVLEGEWPQSRHVVLEFPSAERAREWYDSPEYAPLKALRMSASNGNGILIEGIVA
ncbi:MAG: hypothetical protein ACI9DC_002895 [Gammaproteobacteria bacterium]|jgi:uncharacterized protein (DUF1330 family)